MEGIRTRSRIPQPSGRVYPAVSSGIHTRSQAARNAQILRDVTNKSNVTSRGPIKPGVLSNRNVNSLGQKSLGQKSFGAKSFGQKTLEPKPLVPKMMGVTRLKKAQPQENLYTTATRVRPSLRRPRDGDDVSGRPSKLFKSDAKDKLLAGLERKRNSARMSIVQERKTKDEILPIDKKLGEQNDLYPAEYTKDIFRLLQKTVSKYPIDSEYMTRKQDEISAQMRAILIDWLLQNMICVESFFLFNMFHN